MRSWERIERSNERKGSNISWKPRKEREPRQDFAGDTHHWVVIPNGFGYPKAIPALFCLAHLPPFGNFFTGRRSNYVIGSSHEMQEDVSWGLLEKIFLS